jgi:hypothetical protein
MLLSSQDHYMVSNLLELMFTRFDHASHHPAEIFSVASPYLKICPVCVAISLFATQIA